MLDSQWIGQLSQHGLLAGGFISAEQIHELRDMTRQGKQLIRQRASCAYRVQKVLQDASFKFLSVGTDVGYGNDSSFPLSSMPPSSRASPA